MQADSLYQKAGDIVPQASVSVIIVFTTKNLKERKTYINKAISLQKSGDLIFLADVLQFIGNRMRATSDKEALTYYLKAEETALKSGDKVKLSKVQNSIGYYFSAMLSDYARAMEYYLKELNSAEIANDTLSLITSWIDLGTLYAYLGDPGNVQSVIF